MNTENVQHAAGRRNFEDKTKQTTEHNLFTE